jgi:uncharacterized protein GlcG (DUF336 family)
MSDDLTIERATLDYRAALRALEAAAAQAEALGVQVSIALVGRAGQPLAQLSENLRRLQGGEQFFSRPRGG